MSHQKHQCEGHVGTWSRQGRRCIKHATTVEEGKHYCFAHAPSYIELKHAASIANGRMRWNLGRLYQVQQEKEAVVLTHARMTKSHMTRELRAAIAVLLVADRKVAEYRQQIAASQAKIWTEAEARAIPLLYDTPIQEVAL